MTNRRALVLIFSFAATLLISFIIDAFFKNRYEFTFLCNQQYLVYKAIEGKMRLPKLILNDVLAIRKR